MRLPWRKANLTRIAVDAAEARTAREKAERNLEDTSRRTGVFRRLAQHADQIREENHLTEAFEATFRKGRAS